MEKRLNFISVKMIQALLFLGISFVSASGFTQTAPPQPTLLSIVSKTYDGTYLTVEVKIAKSTGAVAYRASHLATIQQVIPPADTMMIPVANEPANLIIRYRYECHAGVNEVDQGLAFYVGISALDGSTPPLESTMALWDLLNPIIFPPLSLPVDTMPPSIPLNLASTGKTQTTIDLSWSASTDDVSGVKNYNVRRNGVIVGSPTGTTYRDSGLTANMPFAYTVQAVDNTLKLSGLSAEITVVTLAPVDILPPSIPQGLAVSGAGSNFIDLRWTASTDDVSGVKNYNVRRNGANVGSPTGTTYHDTGLTADTAYSYTVEAVDNTNKTSSQSPSISGRTTPPVDSLPPTTPQQLVVTGATVSTISLSWSASTDDVSGVKNYNLRRNGTVVGTPTGTTFSDSGLTADTAYSYTVQAVDNTDKLSNQSPVVTGRTTAPPDTTPPSAPTWDSTHPPMVTQTSIRVTWNFATDLSGIRQYDLSIADAAGTLLRMETISSTTNTYTDANGLAPGTTRLYQLTATDQVGNKSANSTVLSATSEALPPPDTTAPPVPTLIAPAAQGQTSIKVSWNAVSDPSGIGHYLLVLDRNDLSPVSILPTAFCANSTTTLCFFHNNLAAASTHYYKVAAVDSKGNTSAYSAEASATTASPPAADTTPPTIPTGLSGRVRGKGTVSLSWNAAIDRESAVTKYRVRITTNGVSVVRETPYLSFSETTPPGTRTYEVSAVNSIGLASAYSAPLSLTIRAKGKQ